MPIFRLIHRALVVIAVLSALSPLGVLAEDANQEEKLAAKINTILSDKAHLSDINAMLNLVAEGKALYERDEIKLSGHQYCSQAMALAEKGELRLSVRAASKALYIATETDNADLIALTNRDLAIVFSYAGDLEKADRFAREALEHQAINPESVRGPAYKVLGDVAVRQGNFEAAIDAYERSIKESSERFRFLARVSLINARIRKGDLGQARSELSALAIPQDAFQNLQIRRVGAELLLAEGKPADALPIFDVLAKTEAGDESAYFRVWALYGIAKSRLALAQKREAANALSSALSEFDNVRSRFRSDEFKMGLFSDAQSIFDSAVSLYGEMGEVELSVEASERSRARALLDAVKTRAKVASELTSSTSIPLFRQSLKSDERIIVFHMLPNGLKAWVISNKDIQAINYELSRNDVVNLVQSFRDDITEGKRATIKDAEHLGELLISPLKLTPGLKLIFVPHGPLHYLPFQALRIQKQYLIEQYPIAVVPSLSVANRLITKSPLMRGELIAFGNPDIEPKYALSSAEDEVKHISAFFPRRQIFLGVEATKTRFQSMSASANVIHIAAHAEADEVDALYSRILLANENGKQNFLEAREVLPMNLSGVSLVTLSACESALGKIGTGDETLGLSWAFLSAGASTLIASLWPVSDEATEVLMTTLYKRMAEHNDIRQAMQDAQLAVLRRPETAHPFFWAPFNLIGDWRLVME